MNGNTCLLVAVAAKNFPPALQQALVDQASIASFAPTHDIASDDELLELAASLRHESGLLLEQTDGIWSLTQFETGADGRGRKHRLKRGAVIRFDYAELVVPRRLQPATLRAELLVKAVLGRSRKEHGASLNVIDATAGLGRDSLLLAAAGCTLTMLERNPLLVFLVNAAIVHGQSHVPGQALSRMHCGQTESAQYLQALSVSGPQPDVVYLDPMYASDNAATERATGLKKTAAVKKHAQLLQQLDTLFATTASGPDNTDAHNGELLEIARAVALHKVVVKRAPRAPWLGGAKPGASLSGKSVRFDIYAC